MEYKVRHRPGNKGAPFRINDNNQSWQEWARAQNLDWSCEEIFKQFKNLWLACKTLADLPSTARKE